ETYYQLNRAYLLGITLLAFIIPLIQVGFLLPSQATDTQTMVITTVNTHITGLSVKALPQDTSWPLINYLLLGYGLIVILMAGNLLAKIYKLTRLSLKNKTTDYEQFKLVELSGENNAFSFFNYLFVSPGLAISSTIINHELIHIRQKHSWDITYLELLKIINWFNPIIYLLEISMKEVHEFIADDQTVGKEASAAVYTDFLVNHAYGINGNTLVNTFFNKSFLKKRIIMLHQKRSGNAARLKYLLVLPLTSLLLCASTLAFAKDYGWIDITPHHAAKGKSPASGISGKIKRLRVTQNGISAITDKISFKDKSGKVKTYTVNTLTESDKIYLLKTQRMKIEVIEIDGRSNSSVQPISDGIKRSKPGTDTPKYNSKSKAITSKGFKFDETAYLINNKTNYRVIITEKNGDQKEYFKNSSDDAQLAMLKNKYGYTFPTIQIFGRMPPPPPMNPRSMGPPPPPPANPGEQGPPPPPVGPKSDLKSPMPPPQPPAERIIDYDKDNGKVIGQAGEAHTVLYTPAQRSGREMPPLIFVNGKKYDLKEKLKPGQYLYLSASDSTVNHEAGNIDAKRKWGAAADNGVVELYGKVTVEIK
ncbi:MAG: M56 family metallopeptidase, partial [Mucilaginibacter sp.]